MKPIVKKLATAYADGIAQFEHHRLYCIDDFAAGMEAWVELKRFVRMTGVATLRSIHITPIGNQLLHQ